MTPTKRQLDALRAVGRTREAIDAAAARHHAAMVKALSLGVTQSQLAIELDVSRQAVSEYVRRWVTPGKRGRAVSPRQGVLIPFVKEP